MYFRTSPARVLLVFIAALACAQEREADIRRTVTDPPNANSPAGQTPSAPSSYILGPDDQITVQVPHVDELSLTINRPSTRVDINGDINLPLVGSLHAGGLTVRELEAEIRTRLKKFVLAPDVIVEVTDFRSQPVSVLGALNNPGVHQLEGHKSLFEVLSLAGGLRPDAGNTVTITRSLEWGPVPLPNAANDPSGRFSVASVDVRRIIRAGDPAVNIAIKPNDVISVTTADIVYAVGCVRKPGGFALGQKESLSALQVLALAEGLDKFAIPKKAKIIRTVAGTSDHIEIPVDLKKLMTGNGADALLISEDVLFIPSSSKKAALAVSADAIVRVASGVAVYGVRY